MSEGEKKRSPAVAWTLDGVTLVARIALGLVFIWASWFKIADPADFALNIATYQILPDSVINPMAIALPWLELVTGVLLVLGAFSRGAAVNVAGMLVVFIVAILMAMQKDLKISCGCFASEAAEADIGWPKVIEDTVMLAGAVWVVVFGGRRLSVDALFAWLRSRGKKDGEKEREVNDGAGPTSQ